MISYRPIASPGCSKVWLEGKPSGLRPIVSPGIVVVASAEQTPEEWFCFVDVDVARL